MHVLRVVRVLLPVLIVAAVVGAGSSVLSARPDLQNAKRNVDTSWSSLSGQLDQRYVLLADANDKLQPIPGPDPRARRRRRHRARPLARRPRSTAASPPRSTPRTIVEALARRLVATAAASPRVQSNPAALTALVDVPRRRVSRGAADFNKTRRELRARAPRPGARRGRLRARRRHDPGARHDRDHRLGQLTRSRARRSCHTPSLGSPHGHRSGVRSVVGVSSRCARPARSCVSGGAGARLAVEVPQPPDTGELLARLLDANRALLEQERLRATTELDGKKGLIDQQLVSMTGELGKVSELVRELEHDRHKAFGAAHERAAAPARGLERALGAHAATARGPRQLAGARPVGRTHGRGRAAARRLPRRRQLPQAVDARGRGPARLHVPAARTVSSCTWT